MPFASPDWLRCCSLVLLACVAARVSSCQSRRATDASTSGNVFSASSTSRPGALKVSQGFGPCVSRSSSGVILATCVVALRVACKRSDLAVAIARLIAARCVSVSVMVASRVGWGIPLGETPPQRPTAHLALGIKRCQWQYVTTNPMLHSAHPATYNAVSGASARTGSLRFRRDLSRWRASAPGGWQHRLVAPPSRDRGGSRSGRYPLCGSVCGVVL
jgi:hypothetical protein